MVLNETFKWGLIDNEVVSRCAGYVTPTRLELPICFAA